MNAVTKELLAANHVNQHASKTMKSILLVVLSFALSIQSQQAQEFLSLSELGIDQGFGSRLFNVGQNRWMVVGLKQSNYGSVLTLSGRWTIDNPYPDLKIPYDHVRLEAISLSKENAWVGAVNTLSISKGYETWQAINLSEEGHEAKVMSLAPLDEDRALCGIKTYEVTSRDTVGGIVYTEVKDVIHKVVLVGNAGKQVLYADSMRRSGFSNVIRTNSGLAAFSFSKTEANNYYMALLGQDGTIEYVSAPLNMPVGAVPTHLHQAENGDYHSFYDSYRLGDVILPPFVVVYRQSSGKAEIRNFPLGSLPVISAASVGGFVVAISDFDISWQSDGEFRSLQITDGENQYQQIVLGGTFVNPDTLVVVASSGLSIIPMSTLITTSVSQESGGITPIMNHALIDLKRFTNIGDQATWMMFDLNGRIARLGNISPGQESLSIPVDVEWCEKIGPVLS